MIKRAPGLLGKDIAMRDLTVFPKKIIASQYLQLIEYHSAILGSMEFPLQRKKDFHSVQTTLLEGQWSDIQLICSRCDRYLKDVEFIMLQLGIPRTEPDTSIAGLSWTDSCHADFQHVYAQLKALKSRAVFFNESLTGLTGIIGNARSLTEARRSIREAKTVKILTFLAMVFIPLSFTTGLFSMGEDYLPGKSSFWTFFAVSLPMVLFVFGIAVLLDLGYDEKGNWDLRVFGTGVSNLFVRNKKIL
jgi:hypothetical protein